MNVRIQEVATAAEVSEATVSRALRGLPGVGERTRAHVLEVADELGYTPSHSAASLASGSTRSFGLVLPDVSRWFFATAVEDIEQTLRAVDYDALIYSLPDYRSDGRPQFNPNVLRSKVDAVAVLSLFFDEDEVGLLKGLEVPAAFLSVVEPGFPHVGIDDETAMATACEHLIGLGHRVIGHLSGMTNDKQPNAPTQRRRNGWLATLQRHGLEHGADLDSPAQIMTARNGYMAANALLDRRPDVTGIVASSDEMAMGAMQALAERGCTPGRDVSVIGIDGNDLGEAFSLTTVTQPIHDQSECIVGMLLDAIHGDTAIRTRIFPTTLVVRRSTGPRVG
ncbi:MAG: LacI family transcriptional regulator [Bifidobacterium sp.]|jgi:DNA-binding LacI/PurR family transcriptional regulator|nr:LacI family transcriptional regulator [Bifidobacterium sp.]